MLTHPWRSATGAVVAVFATFFSYSAAMVWANPWLLLFVIAAAVYVCVALFLNRTTIQCMNDQLRVQAGPVPFPGSGTTVISRKEIQDVQVRSTVKGWNLCEVEVKTQGRLIALLSNVSRRDAERIASAVRAWQSEATNGDMDGEGS